MPADPSSIPPGLTVLGHADPLRPAETPHLLAYLATVTDPRTRAGRRHRLVAILVLAAAAVLADARSIAAFGLDVTRMHWDMTVRHEARCDRAEVKGLRRPAVAAVGTKLRAA